MTRIGLVARADRTGLGNQSRILHRHLKPAKTLIVSLAGMSATGKDLSIQPEWFPGDTTISDGIPADEVLESWLEGLETVLTIETPYNSRLYTLARQKSVRTVLQGNWELLDYLQDGPHQEHLPDLIVLPSTWNLYHARTLLQGRVGVSLLPVPVPDDITPGPLPPRASRFLHVVGNPAIHDRNGTYDLMAALRHVKSEITVTLACQRPGYLESIVDPDQVPANVSLVISPPVEDHRDLYAGQHAQILPRRYGGLCLPLNEALAAGIPTIMPAISPNSRWLPDEWLVPARVTDTFMAKTPIDIHTTDPLVLAVRIDALATDEDFYGFTRRQARQLADQFSWPSLVPTYERVLA